MVTSSQSSCWAGQAIVPFASSTSFSMHVLHMRWPHSVMTGVRRMFLQMRHLYFSSGSVTNLGKGPGMLERLFMTSSLEKNPAIVNSLAGWNKLEKITNSTQKIPISTWIHQIAHVSRMNISMQIITKSWKLKLESSRLSLMQTITLLKLHHPYQRLVSSKIDVRWHFNTLSAKHSRIQDLLWFHWI